MTLSPRQVRDLLERHGLSPSRALGQNFVADPNTVRRVAALAGVGPGDRVVEVGAGLGSLTLALAETGATVMAIETDRHLIPVLREVVAEEPLVTVVHGDARIIDWDELLAPTHLANPDAGPAGPDEPADRAVSDGPGDAGPPGPGDPADRAASDDPATGPDLAGSAVPGRPDEAPPRPWKLVANLPYNIATSLVLELLERVPAIGEMLVMVQREVAERLAARVGESGYGIPSVKAAWWADAAVVGRVPATVFVPQPRVESALVRLVQHDPPAPPAGVDRQDVFALVDAGFGQRRKMLRRSLAGLVGPEDFAASGVRPESRAEELALDDWLRLATVRARAM